MSVRVGSVLALILAACLGAFTFSPPAIAQGTPDFTLFRELAWRNVGPLRGGRTTSGAGVPSDPAIFYAGTANGVWKTTDAGTSWQPITDSAAGAPIGAVGALAIALSDPRVIYVGTGAEPVGFDTSNGRGVYRSSDAGRTWTEAGLGDTAIITAIAVDPRDVSRVFVAAQGRPFAPSADRGVFRSLDAGRTWQKVLFKDADTGAASLAMDPANPTVLYAALWQARWSPWDASVFTGAGSGLYKTTDGGATWKPSGNGLPTFNEDGLGRITVAVAPGGRGRVFALVEADRQGGLYVSNDAGESWTITSALVTPERGRRAAIAVDPTSPDVVYVLATGAWRSTDGGRTFAAWRRDPASVQYDGVWLNPINGQSALVASSRGAAITVNGGLTWSSILNQPTGRFAHVFADGAFPFRICGAMSGEPAGCLPSRGDSGAIVASDWQPISTSNDGFVAPDPIDTDVTLSGGIGRFDRRNNQIQDITPAAARTSLPGGRAPLLFAPTDSRTLYFATDTLWRSANAGQTWAAISPALVRESAEAPPTLGVFRGAAGRVRARGTISAVAPSPVDGRTIWIGTDDGLVHLTRDGGLNWTNVTPAGVSAWARVSTVEASRFDASTAYVAVDATRLDDSRPHVWRTRDAGLTWAEVTRGGLGDAGPVHVVREDLFRRGLLFAGTARSVFASFDDGDTWRPFGLNLPAVAVRDLTIRDADLVAATDGRGLWVLDDLSPLRQITTDIGRAEAFLFTPATAWRVRASTSSTPPVTGEAAAPNPPDGIAFHYLVGETLSAPLTIEVIETANGEVIRRFTSGADSEGARLATTPGLHRIVWDLRYTPVEARALPVLPGTYQVRLTAGARPFRQAVIVRMDPRARTSTTDLAAQFKVAKALQDKRQQVATVLTQLRQRTATPASLTASLSAAMTRLTAALDAVLQSDLRPTPAADAAATAAIDLASNAIAAAN